MMNRWDNPVDDEGLPSKEACVYAISRDLDTHWVQLLVDDNTPSGLIIAIETRINGLKDDYPTRKYYDEHNNIAPMEKTRNNYVI